MCKMQLQFTHFLGNPYNRGNEIEDFDHDLLSNIGLVFTT